MQLAKKRSIDSGLDLLGHLNPRCPFCGQTGKVNYA